MSRDIFRETLESFMKDRINICVCCGKEFVPDHGGRRYCDKCKYMPYDKRRAIMNKREEDEDAAALKKRDKAQKKDPFNPAYMSDKRLGAVIKMFKMTYGTYTAAYRGGFIVQILKAKGFADPEKMLNELEEN